MMSALFVCPLRIITTTMDNKKNVLQLIISASLLLIIVLYPNVVYAINKDAGWTYILTSCIFSFPIIGLLIFSSKKVIYIIAACVLTIFSIIDLTMIDLYQDYLLPGGIISTIKTNHQEAAEFYRTNLREVLRWLPLIALCISTCLIYRDAKSYRLKLIIVVLSLVVPTCFITGKLLVSYHSELTLRYYLDHRVWNRTPYNVVFQTIIQTIAENSDNGTPVALGSSEEEKFYAEICRKVVSKVIK